MEINSSFLSGETWERVSGRESISLSRVRRILSKSPRREGGVWGVGFSFICTLFLVTTKIGKTGEYYNLFPISTDSQSHSWRSQSTTSHSGISHSGRSSQVEEERSSQSRVSHSTSSHSISRRGKSGSLSQVGVCLCLSLIPQRYGDRTEFARIGGDLWEFFSPWKIGFRESVSGGVVLDRSLLEIRSPPTLLHLRQIQTGRSRTDSKGILYRGHILGRSGGG